MNPANLEALSPLNESQLAARHAAREAANALKSTRKEGLKALREALNSAKGQAAHHKVPWEMRENPLVKKAAEAGWNMNKGNNGMNLPNQLHSGWRNWHEWHEWYNDLAKRLLDNTLRKNPNMTAEEAAQAAQRIADALGRVANQACGVQ
jgi:hypothetical protein